MYEHIYSINPNYECTPEGDGLICINCQSGNWIKLNATSADLFKRVCNKTLDQIIEEMSEELSFPAEVTKAIYDPIIVQLITSELILCADSESKIIPETVPESNVATYPKQIWVHIIDSCNLACSYCYYGAKPHRGEKTTTYINLEKLFAFLDSIPKDEREKITISGGEPFLNKELVQIVTHVKDELQFQEVMVITNGTVHHDLYKEVLPHIDCLQMSIDGTDEKIHDSFRGKGSFDKLLKGIQTAVDCGFKGIRLSFSIHNENLEDLLNLPAFAYEKGIDSLHINKLLKVGRNRSGEGERLSQEKFEQFYASFLDNLRDMNAKIHYEREVLQVGMENRRPFISCSNSFDLYSKIVIAGKLIGCGMGVGMISIDADGTIYPCPSLHHKEFAIGSLDTAYETVKQNGTAFSLEYNVENEKVECYSCKYKYFCGGGCRAEALASGNIYGRYVDCDCFHSELLKNIRDF